jgi:hypothetical protein
MTSRTTLKAALRGLGAVATVAGASGVLRGSGEVHGAGRVSAPVDSEYRFYAAWYAVFGVLLGRAARAPEQETTIVRAAGIGLLSAAAGRLISIRKLGPPNNGQKLLLALEVVIPAVIVPWQTRVARRQTGRTP